MSTIFNQNDRAVNSRTGSPITRTTPVSAMTTRPLHIQGANRLHTLANASSTCTRPRTRNAIIRIETNTRPIIKMWIDCSNGMIQSIDWIVTLRRVVCSHSAKASI